MILWNCPKCGREIALRYEGEYVRCLCSQATPRKICQHRLPVVADASCKCGPIYACGLGGLCGDKKPVDEWVTITFLDGSKKEFRDVEYRRCAECEEFSCADVGHVKNHLLDG